jgi:LacI family gluconate utilization system Gnt-I transcriptional repressor
LPGCEPSAIGSAAGTDDGYRMTSRSRSPRRGHGRATLSDVARLAGVSAITVSRALRSPGLVAEATRKRIDEAVEEIGYIPNLVAGSLASIDSRTVAAVVPTLANSIFAETLQGMVDVLHAHDYRLIVGSNNYDLDEEESLVRAFLASQVEGMILTGAYRSDGTAKLLERANVPVVETWSLLGKPSSGSVGFSNFDAAYAMVEHLQERGYREIGFVSPRVANNDRAWERRRGFLQALEDLGLPIRAERVLTSVMSLGAGAEVLKEIMAKRPETDAIFFAGDTLAAGAVLECQRLGWHVPAEVAIAGFDDLEIAGQVVPSLTTVRVHRHALGSRAAQLVIDLLDGREVGSRRYDLGFELVVREST